MQRVTALSNLGAGKQLLLVCDHLPAHNLVSRLGIARDQHTVKVDRRSLGDHQRHVDVFLRLVDVRHRVDLDKSKSLVRIQLRQRRDIFAQPAAAKNLPGCEFDGFEHLPAVLNQIAADLDLADSILRTFVNSKDDFQAVAGAQNHRIVDLVFDVAVIIVVVRENRHIVGQHIAVEDAAVGDEGKHPFFFCCDFILELALGKRLVAFERDLLDQKPAAFHNVERDHSLIVRLDGDRVIHDGVHVTLVVVQLADFVHALRNLGAI